MVELDNLIGYTTAIGSTTRESGAIIGNSLKTIFARLTTNGQAIGALEEVGIAVSDIEGNVKPVQDILGELAGKWDSLTDAERQNVSVKGAGIYQLSRFNALLNNYDLAVKATNTSINSQGSAMREQEKYGESLEARINRMKTAWLGFSAAVGEGGLYDVIVLTTSALEGLSNVGEGSVSVFNIFSLGLAGLGIAAALLSTRFNSVAASLGTYIKAKTTAAVAAGRLAAAQGGVVAGLTATSASLATASAAAVGATGAVTILSRALTSLLVATGIGAALLIVGVVIEKVVSKMSEMTQESERITLQLNKNSEALTTNKNEVTKLLAEYENLTAVRANSDTWNAEDEMNYLSVQQRLGDMFPALVKEIDATGQSYLLSGQLLKEQIKLTEELIAVKKEESKVNSQDNVEKLIKNRQKIQDEIEGINVQIDSFEDRIKNDSFTLNTEDGQKNLAAFRVKLKELEIQAYNASAEITTEIIRIAEAWATVDITSPIKNQVEEFIRTLDFSDLSAGEIETLGKEISIIAVELDKAFASGNNEEIKKLSTELTNVGSSAKNFNKGITNAGFTLDTLTRAASLTGKGVGSVTEDLSLMNEGLDMSSDEAEDLEKNILNLNKVLEDYSENNEIGADSLNELIKQYPHLIAYINDEGELIKEVTKLRDQDVSQAKQQLKQKLDESRDYYTNNLKLIQSFFNENYKFYEGDLTQFKNLAEAKAAVESELINKLSEKWGVYFNKQLDSFSILEQNGGKEIGYENSLGIDLNVAKKALSAQKELNESRKTFDDFSLDKISLDFDKLGTSLGKSGGAAEKAEKANKEANETTKDSIYITDKYKQKVEELTLAIAKQKSIQEEYPDYSKQYREAIQEEIKLQEKQLELTNQQIKSLEDQVKAGSIKKTGSITIETKNTGSTSTEEQVKRTIAGFGGAITSTYGAKESFRKNPHTGIDIAGKRGSRLETPVSGSVVDSGNTKLSGNYAIVMDDNGYRHFFGHLDSIAVAVKDVVKVGDKIGAIGNTGNVVAGKGGDGSHLHYEIKKNGSNINPANFVNQAKGLNTVGVSKKSNSVTKTASGSVTDNSQEAVDSAISALKALEEAKLKQIKDIQNLEFSVIKSDISAFKNLQDEQDSVISKQEIIQSNLLDYSQENENSINKQFAAEKRKLVLYNQEYDFIQKTLAAGDLTVAQKEELISKSIELQSQVLSSENQIKSYYNEVVSGRLARFDNENKKYQESLDYEERKLASLSRESGNYNKVLGSLSSTKKLQIEEMEKEVEYSTRILSTGNLNKELYTQLTDRLSNLRVGMIEARTAIQDLNYEMIQTNAIISDTKIDDIDFNIEFIKGQRDLLEEGSGAAKNLLEKELTELGLKLDEIENKGKNLQNEIFRADLGQEKLQSLEEQLEENSLAYLGVQKSIKDTEKAIKSFGTEIDNAISEKRGSIADSLIDSLKSAIEQAKDIQLDSIDKLIKAEEKRHEKVLKQYDEQLDSYNQIIEAQRRNLDDSDRDRSYDNKIGDLNNNRQNLLEQRNLLSGVSGYEAKKQTEDLTKQIADIEKEIAEEKYQYEKTLREQQFDDLLDEKTKSIEELKSKEEENSQNTLEALNKQSTYFDSHYSDLLNDERKFAQIKKDIIAGNYTEIEDRYKEYTKLLKDSLPNLENTFDGTWKAVGTQIRENVIDNLALMLEEIKKVEDEITKTNNLKNTTLSKGNSASNLFSNANKTVEGKAKSVEEEYSEADLKVLLAKFINENIAGSLDPSTNKSRISNIKQKSYSLAAEGRAAGSTIKADSSFSTIVGSLSEDKLKQVGDYFQSNASSAGFSTQEYTKAIESFGSTASSGGTLTAGDKKVLLAKYIRENILNSADSNAKKDTLRNITDTLAESGRSNTSLVQASSSYSSTFDKLNVKQRSELGQYLSDNSGTIPYPELKEQLQRYADTLKNSYVGAATGGMTKNYSGSGVDGKGGKQLLIHPNEIINNPLDSERLLKTASVMDNLMRRLSSFNASPNLNRSASGTTDNSIKLEVNIENMSGNKKDVDNLNDQIKNTLLRERGKRR